ncbi:MAG: glycosyltransferase, partial [Syntrophorhabdales bacterium]
AAVVTEANRYLSEVFENDRNIISFPWKELGSLPDRIRSYLSNPETLEGLALSGKSEAERNHGWDSRAKAILSIADRLSGRDRREESFFSARQGEKGPDTRRLQTPGKDL